MDDLPGGKTRITWYQEMLEITRDMLSCARRGEMEAVSAGISRRQGIIEILKRLDQETGGPAGPPKREAIVTLLREMTDLDEAVRDSLVDFLREESARAEEARQQVQMLKNIRDNTSSATPRFYDQKG